MCLFSPPAHCGWFGLLLIAGVPMRLEHARRVMGPRRSNCYKAPPHGRVWGVRSRIRKDGVPLFLVTEPATRLVVVTGGGFTSCGMHRENSLGYGETPPCRAYEAAEDPPRGPLVLTAARCALHHFRNRLPKDGGPWRGREWRRRWIQVQRLDGRRLALPRELA